MEINKNITEFIESIPKENWKLNPTINSTGVTTYGISTKHNGITIDVRLSYVDYPLGVYNELNVCGHFRVCFLEGTDNKTTVMEKLVSRKILGIYNELVNKCKEGTLQRIYDKLKTT
ncbi:MAG TPA: hypothetical protein VN026_17185 [Bacteroidia bacterium]|jgi:hypothetical protein|nr:hypothetical protein [Bacteroidia bacterium]